MLDEKALRREGFDEENSVAIALADGNEWWFPKPWAELCYRSQDGRPAAGGVFTLGADFDDWIERLDDIAGESPESGDDPAASAAAGRRLIEAMFGLAAAMLRRNYELSDAQLGRLLRYRPKDPENGESWRRIMAVARGSPDEAPKPSAVGSGLSSSPTASPAG